MSSNRLKSNVDKKREIIEVAVTVPNSKAVTEKAKEVGVNLSVTALKDVKPKVENKLGVIAAENHEKKTGLGQQAKSDVSAPTRKR